MGTFNHKIILLLFRRNCYFATIKNRNIIRRYADRETMGLLGDRKRWDLDSKTEYNFVIGAWFVSLRREFLMDNGRLDLEYL